MNQQKKHYKRMDERLIKSVHSCADQKTNPSKMRFLVTLACATFLFVQVFGDVSHLTNPEASAPILKQTLDINENGQFAWNYETGNGIAAQAAGAGEGVQGSAKWTAPDGTPVQFSYTADANGYQPQGNLLPTPHPIPEEILRSLEWNAAHPEENEQIKK